MLKSSDPNWKSKNRQELLSIVKQLLKEELKEEVEKETQSVQEPEPEVEEVVKLD